MSEILIKNMALPKQGIKRLILLPDGEVREICGDEAVRATDARAVELPEHGRLGDLDKLASKVAEAQEQMKGKDYDPFMLLGDVLRWIGLTPTILEASE